MPWDLDAYLARIGYAGALAPTPETLAALQRAQMRTVPFEDLDVQLGRPISLAEDAIFGKLVREGRGGWCFEVNGLFSRALEALGFRITRLAARVWIGPPGPPGPPTHQLTLVETGGRRWIADVGFGGYGPFDPLPLEAGREETQRGERFRIVEGPYGYMLQTEVGGEGWRDLYSFDLHPKLPVDYVPANHFLQHDPSSIFVHRVLCAVVTDEGRTILDHDALKFRRGSETRERPVPREELAAALREHFGLELAPDARLRGERALAGAGSAP